VKTQFDTNFTIMPTETNYMSPLVFGGSFFSHLDMAAAQAANRVLHSSPIAKAAVTHVATVQFLKPCYMGDLIHIHAEVVEVHKKSISINVTAHREKPGSGIQEVAAVAKFVFVSILDRDSCTDRPDLLPYVYHELDPVELRKTLNENHHRT